MIYSGLLICLGYKYVWPSLLLDLIDFSKFWISLNVFIHFEKYPLSKFLNLMNQIIFNEKYANSTRGLNQSFLLYVPRLR